MDFLETSPISPEAFTTLSAGTTSSSLYLPLPVSPFIGITKEIPPEEHHTSITEELWESVFCCYHHHLAKEDSEATHVPKAICVKPTSMYTVFGSLCYDLINQKQEATPQIQQEIKEWLSQKPGHHPLAGRIGIRNNCIVILAESLESWILEREVEGQEITPYLNKLLQDSTTLYAPRVLTQVKGGRSIDAQLLLCAGMLPINSGTYSSQYPDHTYGTLQKPCISRRTRATTS